MSNIYSKVTTETLSKLRFSGFKKFVTRSAFGELEVTQISFNFKTSCCNLKIRRREAKLCVAFLLWRYDALKSKSPCILLNKNINFNKNETESKMEKATHTVLEKRTLCLLAHIKISNKDKTVMSWSSRKKKEGILCTVYFVRSESI